MEEQIAKRKFPKFFWIILIVFFIIFGVVFAKAYNFGNKVFVSRTSFFKKAANLIFHGSATTLQGESDDRINILLLGYGGEGHDGIYLTDSIILASIKPSTHEVFLTSIPRDYYWQAGAAKINYAFAAAMEKYKDQNRAGEAAEQAVESISGLSIPYFATIDFKGFIQAVDRVGGLDITVEKTFTDSQYPDSGYGYLPPITFEAGPQHMDGVRALEFARSRHGSNGEDSDFARSRRQALILSAFKNKVENLGLLSNSGTLNDLINILASHAHTNLDPDEILHLEKLVGKDSQTHSRGLVVNDTTVCQGIDEKLGYLIKPCAGATDADIKKFFETGFSDSPVADEKPFIIMENAGTDNSLFMSAKSDLEAQGASVYIVAYKGLPIQHSVLYEVNSKPATIRYLESKFNIKAQPKPAQMTAKADLVLIIGGPQ